MFAAKGIEIRTLECGICSVIILNAHSSGFTASARDKSKGVFASFAEWWRMGYVDGFLLRPFVTYNIVWEQVFTSNRLKYLYFRCELKTQANKDLNKC